MKIFRVGIGQISIPDLGQAQRLAVFFAQGLASFHAKCVSEAKCVSSILVSRLGYISFTGLFFNLLALVSGSGYVSLAGPFTLHNGHSPFVFVTWCINESV